LDPRDPDLPVRAAPRGRRQRHRDSGAQPVAQDPEARATEDGGASVLMSLVRPLQPSDATALEAFLAWHPTSCRSAACGPRPSSRRAYLALGFEIVGDYGLVLLAR